MKKAVKYLKKSGKARNLEGINIEIEINNNNNNINNNNNNTGIISKKNKYIHKQSQNNEQLLDIFNKSKDLIEDYFQAECQSKVLMLAAQAKHVRFGVPPSTQIVAAVDEISKLLREILDPTQDTA